MRFAINIHDITLLLALMQICCFNVKELAPDFYSQIALNFLAVSLNS